MKHHAIPASLAHLAGELEDLERRDLRRRRPAPRPGGALSFCTNDYLGLGDRPLAGVARAPSGAGASRLIAGERTEHVALEAAVAEWLGTEAALLFPSGFAANLALLSALVQPEDLVVSDAFNHASIVDGCRLARARVAVVPHLDTDAVTAALHAPRVGRAWVVTESYFSMDADSPDLRVLRAACDAAGAALLVDEAHAIGVFGPQGAGLLAQAGVQAEAVVGTLGKALGHAGAFVAGPSVLVDWLWNRARPFVFSTGISPALAASARVALEEVRGRPELAARTLVLATRLRQALRDLGLTPLGHGHVVPVVLGSPTRALALSARLAARGIEVPPIRPPTVPVGTCRLRIALTARHTESDVDQLTEAVRDCLPDLPP